MSSDDLQKFKLAAEAETIVSNIPTRFFEDPYELQTGKPADAALGLEHRMAVSNIDFHQNISKGLEAIESEINQLSEMANDGKELLEMLRYILHEETSEKEYVNGIRDKGRGRVDLSYFLMHSKAQEAHLIKPEVVSLRLYTTVAYKYMNDPLRDSRRHVEGRPCLLPITTYFAAQGIKKLRGLHAESESKFVLWRGMRQVKVADDFLRNGGTELAFMSATKDLNIAVRYSLSQHSLLFKITPSDFMSVGADLQWLSVFPDESEILYPPLTYMRPTGKADKDRKSVV